MNGEHSLPRLDERIGQLRPRFSRTCGGGRRSWFVVPINRIQLSVMWQLYVAEMHGDVPSSFMDRSVEPGLRKNHTSQRRKCCNHCPTLLELI